MAPIRLSTKAKPATTKSKATKVCKNKAEPNTLKRRSARGARDDPVVGKYEVIITSGHKNKCGMHALHSSTEAQLATALTPAVFDRIIDSDASIAWHTHKNWLGTEYQRNYQDEQLALVLYMFGREHGLTLQMGMVVDGWPSYTMSMPKIDGFEAPDETNARTVWIHNDNGILIKGRNINHYSGINKL